MKKRALLNVTVVGNVILTVAVVAFALGTVAEFQIGMFHVGASADGAFVMIGGFYRCVGCFIGTGVVKRNGLMGLSGGGLAHSPAGIDTPGSGQYIQHILAEEQEVIAQRNQGINIAGEGAEQADEYNHQIKHGQDPGSYRDDEENQELCIRLHGGISQEQTHVQVVRCGGGTENHTPDIHQDDTGEIEQIEPERSPNVLHGSAHGIVAEQGNGSQKNAAAGVTQGIGEQSPYLSLQNGHPVKAKQIIKGVAVIDQAHQVHDCRTRGNIKHQVGDASVSVCKTESVKPTSKIFQ